MPKIFIEFSDQFGHWRQYTTKHNERDAYRVASSRAQSTGKRHRLIDENGNLLDIFS